MGRGRPHVPVCKRPVWTVGFWRPYLLNVDRGVLFFEDNVPYDEQSESRGWRRAVLILVVEVIVLCIAVGVAPAAVVPDMLGRHVTIPDRPLRVVSLAPSITETIYASAAPSQ